MKIVITLFATVLLFTACSSKSEFQKPIEDHIKNQIMGLNLKLHFEKIVVLDTIMAEKSLSEWYRLNMAGKQDFVEQKVNQLINFWKKNNTNGEYDAKIKMWQFKLNRFHELINKKGVDYYVVNAKYNIVNPIFVMKLEEDKVFLISDGKVLGESDKEKLDTTVDKNTMYELVMFASARR